MSRRTKNDDLGVVKGTLRCRGPHAIQSGKARNDKEPHVAVVELDGWRGSGTRQAPLALMCVFTICLQVIGRHRVVRPWPIPRSKRKDASRLRLVFLPSLWVSAYVECRTTTALKHG